MQVVDDIDRKILALVTRASFVSDCSTKVCRSVNLLCRDDRTGKSTASQGSTGNTRQKRDDTNGTSRPSRESIRSDNLVRDLKLGVGSVDDAGRARIVSPRMDRIATFRRDRDCPQGTDDREKGDQTRQRETVHLGCVANRGRLERSSSPGKVAKDERSRPLGRPFCMSTVPPV